MKRIILFSMPTQGNQQKILSAFFPPSMKQKVFAYMPSDGADAYGSFTNTAKLWAAQKGAQFLYINNAVTGKAAKFQCQKLLSANILLIAGGDTYVLLRNLKRSGLYNAILAFIRKLEFIIGGFSAGAIALTPTIEICNLDCDNTIGLRNFNALGIFRQEVFPHYDKSQEPLVHGYEKATGHKVLRLANDELKIINRK